MKANISQPVNMNKDIIEVFPGDLKTIAEVAGPEAAVKIARTFGGVCVYVPALGELTRRARDEIIRREYRRGTSARKLARKHRLTARQIRKIVRNAERETLPEDLLALLVEPED